MNCKNCTERSCKGIACEGFDPSCVEWVPVPFDVLLDDEKVNVVQVDTIDLEDEGEDSHGKWDEVHGGYLYDDRDPMSRMEE